jgi:hypothetical protein
MGIVGRFAENTIAARVKQGAGAVIAGATGLLSLRVIAGIGAGVLLVCGFMWWKATSDRDVANGRLDEVAQIIAAANGGDKVDRKKIVSEVRTIITERAIARRERDGYKTTAETQTREVRRLNEETERMRAQSARQIREVQSLTRQRDRWIAEAQKSATRTQPRSDQEELRQMQEVLDALYRNGF